MTQMNTPPLVPAKPTVQPLSKSVVEQPAKTKEPELLPRVNQPQQVAKEPVAEQTVHEEEHRRVEEIAADNDILRDKLGEDPARHVNLSRRMCLLQEQGQLLAMLHARPRSQRVTALDPYGVPTNVTLQREEAQTRESIPLNSSRLPSRVPLPVT